MQIEDRFPDLRTSRLCLRRIRPTDADALFAFRGDPVGQRYNGPTMLSSDDANQLIQELEIGFLRQSMIHWGLTLESTDIVIGLFGFANWSFVHRRAEVGYCLHRDYWGHGFALEALKAIVAYGFREMDLNRIHANTWQENYASVRLLEKCAFQKEGTSREEYFADGSFHDECHYALLIKEWETLNSPHLY